MQIDKVEDAYNAKMRLKCAIEQRDALLKKRSIRYVELAFNGAWPVKAEDMFHIERFSEEFGEEIYKAYLNEYNRIVAKEQFELDAILNS